MHVLAELCDLESLSAIIGSANWTTSTRANAELGVELLLAADSPGVVKLRRWWSEWWPRGTDFELALENDRRFEWPCG